MSQVILEGQVEKIIHQAEDFFVFTFRSGSLHPLKSTQTYTVSGTMFGLNLVPGLSVKLHGQWVQHPKFGMQLSPTSWDLWAPNLTAARDVLVYGLGASRSTAFLLTDALKEDTLAVLGRIQQESTDLTQYGRTEADREELQRFQIAWTTLLARRDFAQLLTSGGLTGREINSAFFRFRDELHLVRDNPYLLAGVPNLRFGKLDVLADQLTLQDQNRKRLMGGVLWALRDALNEGHLFLDVSALEDFCLKERIDCVLPPGGVRGAIRLLHDLGIVVAEEGAAYLKENWNYEQVSAHLLADRAKQHVLAEVDVPGFIKEYERSQDIQLSEEQQQAIAHMVEHRVLVITGLPGTGKTASVRALIRLLEEQRVTFHLMAPTGIAAKRLAEVTGHPAMTIHRTLGFNGMTWRHNSSNKFVVDAVVVDEMSMVDQQLLYQLLDALPETTRLILVGDDAQLPSVGAGNVLRELARCPAIPTVRLTKIFRQAAQSAIVRASHAIHQGTTPELAAWDSQSEFKFVPLSGEERMVTMVVGLAKRYKAQDANFQVLSPKYAGEVGVDNLNLALRDALNPSDDPKAAWAKGSVDLREGDRVMVVVNDYQKGVFNGDMGKVIQINSSRFGKGGETTVYVKVFGAGADGTDLEVAFKGAEVEQKLKLAFAVTVHKCVDPETIVEGPWGLAPISDIPSEGFIATPQGARPYSRKVTNPSGPMLEVTTTSGYSVTVTPEHGLDVWDGASGYVRQEASQIAPGAIIRLQLGATYPNIPGTVELPERPATVAQASKYRIPDKVTLELAEFLGLMVADGTVYDKGFRLVKRHSDVLHRFGQLCQHLFEVQPHAITVLGTSGLEVNSVELSKWLLLVGGLAPHAKGVPAVIMRSPLATQAAFLRGLFEDGTANVKQSSGGPVLDHLELVSEFPQLLKAVQVMLLRLGIISSRTRTKANPVLYIYGENARRFSAVGFLAAFKQNRLALGVGKETHYWVPVLREELLAIAAANGGRGFFTHTEKNAFSRHRLSRHVLQGLIARAVPGSVPPSLEQRLHYHHEFVTVVRKTEGPSVCVEVPEGHQFLQNGFCGWNCQGQEFDNIILPLTLAQGPMLQRNLLYTAVTRAKHQVWLLGEKPALERAIANNQVVFRRTRLGARIEQAIAAGNSSARG